MQKSPLHLIVLTAIFFNIGLYGQHIYVASSTTNPQSPGVFKLSYGSSTELEFGIMAFPSKRVFFTVGFAYLSKSYDNERLVRGAEGYTRVAQALGGSFSFISLQAGLGYVFLQPTKWIHPFLSGSLAVGPYNEDTIFTSPSSEFEVGFTSRLSARSKIGAGIQSWVVRDKFALTFAYEYAMLYAGENRDFLNFSVFRVQASYR